VAIADISNPNTSVSKIILRRPIYECTEIAFSVYQNSENEHCETLKKQVHKLDYHN